MPEGLDLFPVAPFAVYKFLCLTADQPAHSVTLSSLKWSLSLFTPCLAYFLLSCRSWKSYEMHFNKVRKKE